MAARNDALPPANSSSPARPKAPTGQDTSWAPTRNPILDEANALIVQALLDQGRASIREIADLVGRTESTVRERIAKLEKHGVLLGYGARIDWARVGFPLEVIFEADSPAADLGAVTRHLVSMPNVIHVVSTTGLPNLLTVVRAKDMGDVRKLAMELGRGPLPNVRTRVVTQQLVANRPPRQVAASARRSASQFRGPAVAFPPTRRGMEMQAHATPDPIGG